MPRGSRMVRERSIICALSLGLGLAGARVGQAKNSPEGKRSSPRP